jgi:hypothetical protein
MEEMWEDYKWTIPSLTSNMQKTTFNNFFKKSVSELQVYHLIGVNNSLEV